MILINPITLLQLYNHYHNKLSYILQNYSSVNSLFLYHTIIILKGHEINILYKKETNQVFTVLRH